LFDVNVDPARQKQMGIQYGSSATLSWSRPKKLISRARECTAAAARSDGARLT